MKKKMMVLSLAIALLLVFAVACSKTAPAEPTPPADVATTPAGTEPTPDLITPPEDLTTDPAITDDPANTDDAVGLPNPVVDVADAAAIQSELGLAILTPEGATDAQYSIIGGKTAQVTFTYEGNSYTHRIEKTDALTDISGMFVEFTNSKDMTKGDFPYQISYNDGAEGIATWYDELTKASYSVSMDANASETLLQFMAEALIHTN